MLPRYLFHKRCHFIWPCVIRPWTFWGYQLPPTLPGSDCHFPYHQYETELYLSHQQTITRIWKRWWHLHHPSLLVCDRTIYHPRRWQRVTPCFSWYFKGHKPCLEIILVFKVRLLELTTLLEYRHQLQNQTWSRYGSSYFKMPQKMFLYHENISLSF